VTLAHVAGVPLEELLMLAPAVSAYWIALRAARPRAAQRGPANDCRPTAPSSESARASDEPGGAV
jgi:hypothetical protein